MNDAKEGCIYILERNRILLRRSWQNITENIFYSAWINIRINPLSNEMRTDRSSA